MKDVTMYSNERNRRTTNSVKAAISCFTLALTAVPAVASQPSLIPPPPNVEPLPVPALPIGQGVELFGLIADKVAEHGLNKEIEAALQRAAPQILPSLKKDGDGYAVQINIYADKEKKIYSLGNGGEVFPIGPGESPIEAAAHLYYVSRGDFVGKPDPDGLLRSNEDSCLLFFQVKNGKIVGLFVPGPGDLSALAEGKRLADEQHAAEEKSAAAEAAARKAAEDKAAADQAAAAAKKAAADRAKQLAELQAAALQQQQFEQERQRQAAEQQARLQEAQRERDAEFARQQAQIQAEQAQQAARMAEQQRQFAEQQRQQQEMFLRQQQLMQQSRGGGGLGSIGGGGPVLGGPP